MVHVLLIVVRMARDNQTSGIGDILMSTGTILNGQEDQEFYCMITDKPSGITTIFASLPSMA